MAGIHHSHKVFLGIALFLLIADRTLLLLDFGWLYTGNDDVVMWLGANDYLQGRFREPYFYGQNYNFMLEALLAAPLLVVLPHHMALPLATSLLALLPWVAFAWAFYRRGQHTAALVFLVTPLALPVEYGMLTTISRGFVTGLAAMSLLSGVLSRTAHDHGWAWFGLASGLGVVLNPNCLVFLVPVLLYLWLTDRPGPRELGSAALAAAPFPLLQYFSKDYYASNPDHLVHWLPSLHYEPFDVLKAFTALDRYFSHLTPVWWSWGWGITVMLAALAWWLWRLDRRAAWSMAGGLLATLLMLGVNKVSDGVPSLFHSSSRMFIGLPLVLALGLALGIVRMDAERAVIWRNALLVVGLVVFSVKTSVLGTMVDRHTAKEDQGPVAVTHLKWLEDDLAKWRNLCRTYGVDLIVLVPDWNLSHGMMSVRAYGAEVMDPSLPTALLSVNDRRTWSYHEHRDAVHGTVLLYGNDLNWELAGGLLGCDLVRPGEHMVLVRNNTRNTRELLSAFGLSFKRRIYPLEADPEEHAAMYPAK